MWSGCWRREVLGQQQPDPQPLKGGAESGLELDPSRAFPVALTAAEGTRREKEQVQAESHLSVPLTQHVP